MRETIHTIFVALFQLFDYGLTLPFLARLPVWAGQYLAMFRGIVNALFDLDWRSIALRRRYVRSATFKAMRKLMPQASMLTLCWKTMLRFVHYSREEWEACRIAARRLEKVVSLSKMNEFNPLLVAQQEGRGIVLITAHFDSFITGVALLGAQGLKVNLMTSDVVEDQRLSSPVRQFYAKKYRFLECYMNGGRAIHVENGAKYFYRALAHGEALVVLADLPGVGSKADIAVNFLGHDYLMAGGALRLAAKTGSLFGGFVCINRGPGLYEVICSPLCDAGLDKSCMQQAYSFLEKYMTAMPERWWTAEQLQAYRPI